MLGLPLCIVVFSEVDGTCISTYSYIELKKNFTVFINLEIITSNKKRERERKGDWKRELYAALDSEVQADKKLIGLLESYVFESIPSKRLLVGKIYGKKKKKHVKTPNFFELYRGFFPSG